MGFQKLLESRLFQAWTFVQTTLVIVLLVTKCWLGLALLVSLGVAVGLLGGWYYAQRDVVRVVLETPDEDSKP